MKNNSKVSIVGGNGFSITCDNGLLVSVQFGKANHCDNGEFGSPLLRAMTCANAEVHVSFEHDDISHYWGEDTVQGYVPADEVARLIGYCQGWVIGTPFVFAVKFKK